MLNNPILEALLAPLARREDWELEVYDGGGKRIAKRDKVEIKPELWKGLRVGQSRQAPNGCTILRVK